MTDAVIQATYHNIVFVKTRKVVQIVLEAPIEHAQHVIEVLGTPNPAEEHWVAVARLVAADKVKLPKPTENPEGHTAKKHFEACCSDPAFQAWMNSTTAVKAYPGEDFRERLKGFLGIETANDFLTDKRVAQTWGEIFTSYKYRDEVR